MEHINTYEEIIEGVLRKLHLVDSCINMGNIDWDSFIHYSERIHERFIIPGTTISPVMRRFLFMISSCKRPVTIVAAGAYVGYALSWLIGGACSGAMRKDMCVTAIDTDEEALSICRENLSCLPGHNTIYVREKAEEYVYQARNTIDLLFIDIDNVRSGKSGYIDVLNNFYPALSDSGYILAHDSNEKKFAVDFKLYHKSVFNKELFSYTAILPLDSCGITLSIKK